jgi:predicted P-loop ATPase
MALPPDFVDRDKKSHVPLPTFMNACVAIHKLGVPISYDMFRDKRYVGDLEMTTDASGQVSDEACLMLRHMCRQAFEFDPGKNNMWDAVMLETRRNAFHPIKDYLRSLHWDGKQRIETWLTDYMGVDDSKLARAMSRLVLIASVRRIYKPGTKYDLMIVLESPEGFNKSSALRTLYGAENFSDQNILGVEDKQLHEALRGRWCLEAADLSGMRKAEVEKVKAQITREVDRTRPAYGRAVVETPRSVVMWGTTNDMEYLRSQTGNRRFVPFKVGRIDLDALERDRDQLWAEAAFDEDFETDLMLPEALWETARAEQDKRTIKHPWHDLIEAGLAAAADNEAFRSDPEDGTLADPKPYYQDDGVEERVTSRYLLSFVLDLKPSQQTPDAGKIVGDIVRRLGWNGPQTLRIGGHVAKGYWRPVTQERNAWDD